MPSVVLRDGESQQELTRRFRKKIIRSKLLSEVRKRRWFISKSEERRMDKKKAIRRAKQKNNKYNNYNR